MNAENISDNMSQSDIATKLSALMLAYELSSGCIEYLGYTDYYTNTVGNASPDFSLDLSKIFTASAPSPKGAKSDKKRPDLTSSLWADVHRLCRGFARPLVQEINNAAKQRPDNRKLTALAEISTDMYEALQISYKASKTVEKNFRNRISEQKKNVSVDEKKVLWKEYSKDELENDEDMSAARKNLAAIFPDEKTLIENRASILADYADEFPEIPKQELLDIVLLSEKAAAYTFASKHGMISLFDINLNNAVGNTVEVLNAAVHDLAKIYDMLNAFPYNIAVGFEAADFERHLKDHSRQVKLYELCDAIATNRPDDEDSYLVDAIGYLNELGLDEVIKIKTIKEMAVLVGSFACQQHNSKWMKFSEELYKAETADEAQRLIKSDLGEMVMDGIINLRETHCPNLASGRELLVETRSRFDELTINLMTRRPAIAHDEASINRTR